MRNATMKATAIPAALLLAWCLASPATAATQAAADSSGNAAINTAEAWAFPKKQTPDPSAPHAQAPESDPNAVVHIPGSAQGYTQAQLSTDSFAPDWFPQDHPTPPRIILHGRKPAMACGACHQPDGRGDPASASLAGLPLAYIEEQLQAFRDGERARGLLFGAKVMHQEATDVSATELKQAATYFSGLKFHRATRVVETASVPMMHWRGFVQVPDKSGTREPIGNRVIETPESFVLYDLNDERAGFVAYVPPGSIQRGAVIAAKGAGTAASCESCHGANLQGVGDIPYLAGRSPTYIVREMILFRLGQRTNPGAAPMRAEVSQLTLKDMIDVAAYAASRQP